MSFLWQYFRRLSVDPASDSAIRFQRLESLQRGSHLPLDFSALFLGIDSAQKSEIPAKRTLSAQQTIQTAKSDSA